MAWDTKYRLEIADRLGVVWRVDIEDETAASTITTLKGTGDPLNFNFLAGSEDMFDNPVRGTSVEIGIYAETDFQWVSLYNYGNLAYRVSVYYNTSTLYWRGFINSDGYQEPYDGAAYPVILSASDGLGQLKEMPYKYTTTTLDDTYYNGRMLESQIIIDILAKIGVTGFTEFVNLYESTMDATVDDSPFDQIKIDVDVFKDMDCYEVLEHILSKYNAVIRQIAGVMIIYRPLEIKETTIYGRVFTTATTKTSTTRTTDQLIDRITAPTDFRQVSGNMLIQNPIKKITINQDYGYKESWVDNFEFKGDTYDPATYLFENWTRVGTAGYQRNVSYFLLNKDETDGVGLIPSGAAVPDTTKNIYQNFAINAIDTTNVFMIEFQYRVMNFSGAFTETLCIEIKSNNSNHWLKIDDDLSCSWATTQSYITFSVAVGGTQQGEWITFSRNFVGIPTDGSYRITLFAFEHVSCFLGIKDIKFIETSDTFTTIRKKRKRRERLIRKGHGLFYGVVGMKNKYYYVNSFKGEEEITVKEFEILNAIKGDERDNDYILGDVPNISTPPTKYDTQIDNIIEQFMGSLGRATIQTLTEAAADFVTDHATEYSPGGVLVTQGTGAHTNDLIFTSSVAGTDFTGNTTITNTVTNLAGSVVHTQANVTGLQEIDDIALSGSSGTANLTSGGVTKLATYSSSLAATANNFVTVWAADYATAGVTITSPSSGVIRFMRVSGSSPLGTMIDPVSGTLNGTKTNTQEYRAAVARIDTITLTGSYGSANILCDGVTKEVAIEKTLIPTSGVWATRDGSEDKPLLELIGDEIASQTVRPQQFLTLPIKEKGVVSVNPLIKIIGNFQDSLNKYLGNNRVFCFHGGAFDVKNREWEIDMIEIIGGKELPTANVQLGAGAAYTLVSQSASIVFGSQIITYSFTVSGMVNSPNGMEIRILKNTVEISSDELYDVSNNVVYSGTYDSGSVASYGDEYILELGAEL